MAEKVLIAKKDVVLTDPNGVQRQVLSGHAVPADLREAYEAQTKPKSSKPKKKS